MADLQPVSDETTNQIALDETVIQMNDKSFWLYAVFRTEEPFGWLRKSGVLSNAVDPATNHSLYIRLFPRQTIAMTGICLRDLRQKHDVDVELFLVDGAPWLQTAFNRHGLDFRHETHGDRNTVERFYYEVKRRMPLFSNTFSHVDSETAET